MYTTKEEAHQKLSGCVCLFNGMSVLIDTASGNKGKVTLSYRVTRTGETRSNLITEDGWEFRNLGPRIGYANLDFGTGSYKEAAYLTRAAVRQAHSTQGLSSKNVKIPKLRGSSKLGLAPLGISWTQVYLTPSFADMVEQKYPCLEEVKNGFKKEPWLVSSAFSRQFAINKPDVGPFYIEYRGKNIGYSEDLDKWRIDSEFDYLRETLEHIQLRIG